MSSSSSSSASSSSSSSLTNLPNTSPYGFGQPPTNHLLHPSYSHKVLQTWSSEHMLTIPKASLVYPLFIVENVRTRYDDYYVPQLDRLYIPTIPGPYFFILHTRPPLNGIVYIYYCILWLQILRSTTTTVP